MAVRTFVQPDNSTQTGALYKGSIDDSIAVAGQIAGQFAPHAKGAPDLNVSVDAGRMFVNGALVSQNQQTVAGFVAAAANQRIDRIVIDAVTGVASRVAGVESATPAAPAVPIGKLPVAQIGPFTPLTTAVTNSMVTDERILVLPQYGNLPFPATQVPSSDPNTLDDYEEGTYTPRISFGGLATGVTYTSQVGRYTKIGRLVTVAHAISLSSKGSSTGSLNLEGLPFNSVVGTGALWVGTVDWRALAVGFASVFCEISGLTTANVIGVTGAAATTTNLQDTHVSASTALFCTLTYET
jgi:hypothetical protein